MRLALVADPSTLPVEDGYRLTPDRSAYYGCARCQNGDHWACHGCNCPCSDQNPWGGGEIYTEEQKAVIEAVGWRKGTPMYVDLQR